MVPERETVEHDNVEFPSGLHACSVLCCDGAQQER